ncbi:MAG: alanine--tRNA ligase [Bacillota bacterium]
MKSNEIRDVFLHFFKEKKHLILPSFSLVPQNDPTLLLIGAGMAPLKPYFTGEKQPPSRRVATCQKCVRTPDLEKVGLTARHATFFEMLGNFSFGDYFKEEAIVWAWELMTQGYGFPEERLYASIYQDDDESFVIWHNIIGLPESKIFRLGKDDNFWEIGTGPCGPCSEIYFDRGPAYSCGRENCTVGCDCDRYLEVWNLVFTQFNKEPDGSYTPLKQKNIDTGAGLERLAVALQGVSSLFEIDTVRLLLDYFAGEAGALYGEDEKKDVSLRVITDHLRSVTFMTADGIMPANEGRGYVLRRILRRAVRHGKLLGLEAPFLYKAVPLLVELMGDTYPELVRNSAFIIGVTRREEERFRDTLGQGMELLEKLAVSLREKKMTVMPGKDAFKLYDTFGFPLDLTREIMAEKGFIIDEDGFTEALEEQRTRARAALAQAREEGGNADLWSPLMSVEETPFLGYETMEAAARVLAIISREGDSFVRQEKSSGGDEVYILLDRTPFYAEKGGQVGDTGEIHWDGGTAAVTATLAGPGGEILHRVTIKKGSISQGAIVQACVDRQRRQAVARNHTATHLLHKALKEVLGDHVNQAGSLVAPERLRFDFTHIASLSTDELSSIEALVNDAVLRNYVVEPFVSSLQEAMQMGAVALFDEKYGEKVRVVRVGDFSLELCGGTHVASTGEIGMVKILHEGGVGTGLRRIEALTGTGAYRYLCCNDQLLKEAASLLKTTPDSLVPRLNELLDSQKELQRRVKNLQQQIGLARVESLLEHVDHTPGVPVLSVKVDAQDAETLRVYLDKLREGMKSGVILLGSVTDGKVLFAAAVTDDLVKKGLHAGKLMAEVARITGGGGGGRPDMAQAGGKDTQKLNQALAIVPELVRAQQQASKNN